MTKTWIECEPFNSETRGMMFFMLTTCQSLKLWVMERRKNGELKPGGEEGEGAKRQEKWLQEYLEEHTAAKDIPRYTLRQAIDEVWEADKTTNLARMRSWSDFSVEPRQGWSAYVTTTRKKLTYEEWLAGKTNAPSRPRVTADKAVEDLFDHNVIRFRWGQVFFENVKGLRAIRRLAMEHRAVNYGSFFARIEEMTFRYHNEEASWQVKIDLAEGERIGKSEIREEPVF